MKFTIEKNVILNALTNVIKAISIKNIIPILNGIKMELTEEGLYLTASNSELTIKQYIKATDIKTIDKTGIIIIQSKFIVEMIRKMPTDLIEFELIDDTKIRIYSEINEYKLNCLPVDDYPNVSLDEHKDPIVINSLNFKEIINQTVFAISTQEIRPLLTGINFKINNDLLEVIATDSYRLSKKNIKLSTSINNIIDIVIPGKNIIELEKILTEEKDLELHVFNNKILFKYDNIIFQSNLLSGQFPFNTASLPKEFAYLVKINLDAFAASVDRASLLTLGKDKNVVKMNIIDNKIKITSTESELGKVEENLVAETNNKNELEISFSAKYMLDALKVIKDEELLIMLNNDISPIIMKSVKDESLIELILPIKSF